jgi:hypothetical protein
VASCFTSELPEAVPMMRIKALKSFFYPAGKCERYTFRTTGTKTLWVTVLSAMIYFHKE